MLNNKKKLKVLFVSGELIAGDVAYRLKQEGCVVKLYIKDESRKDCFDGMVEKTDDWKKELDWVGKDGLIVFDDVIFDNDADELSKKGFNVFGGNKRGNELELNREFAQKIFKKYGLKTLESRDFQKATLAIKYIEKNKGKWVVKQNGHDGSLTYIGSLDDGSDAISILKNFAKYNSSKSLQTISLQKRVDGVEVAVARYFNGQDWTSPIFISFEHKPLLDGDRGPLTAEMGTLAWYDKNEKNKLFLATLEKIKPYLMDTGYKGYVDINSIVSEDKLFPLEATMRFGSPTNQLQSEMHLSPWKNLLWNTATGKKFELKYKIGYSIVVSVAIPPFPYKSISSDYYLKDVQVLFKGKLTSSEKSQLHFEEVSMRDGNIYIAGSNGYILFSTGNGVDVEIARKKAYSLVDKLVIPRMLYRTDIGAKYVKKDSLLLKKWGWI